METLADRIRDALRVAGLKQMNVEALAGASKGHLSRVLSGEKADLKAHTLANYAAVLGVEAEWLLSGKGPRRTKETPAAGGETEAGRARRLGESAGLVPRPRPHEVATAPRRIVDRDDAPWKQLAAVNASFDAWAGGRYRRAADKDVATAGLNYAARRLPRHSEEGGAEVEYRAKEMERLALIGEALDRGEDVEEEPEPPAPPPLPKAPPKPSLAERAAKIEEESKARSKRGSGGTKPSM